MLEISSDSDCVEIVDTIAAPPVKGSQCPPREHFRRLSIVAPPDKWSRWRPRKRRRIAVSCAGVGNSSVQPASSVPGDSCLQLVSECSPLGNGVRPASLGRGRLHESIEDIGPESRPEAGRMSLAYLPFRSALSPSSGGRSSLPSCRATCNRILDDKNKANVETELVESLALPYDRVSGHDALPFNRVYRPPGSCRLGQTRLCRTQHQGCEAKIDGSMGEPLVKASAGLYAESDQISPMRIANVNSDTPQLQGVQPRASGARVVVGWNAGTGWPGDPQQDGVEVTLHGFTQVRSCKATVLKAAQRLLGKCGWPSPQDCSSRHTIATLLGLPCSGTAGAVGGATCTVCAESMHRVAALGPRRRLRPQSGNRRRAFPGLPCTIASAASTRPKNTTFLGWAAGPCPSGRSSLSAAAILSVYRHRGRRRCGCLEFVATTLRGAGAALVGLARGFLADEGIPTLYSGVDLSRPHAMKAHRRWGFKTATREEWSRAGLLFYEVGDVHYMQLAVTSLAPSSSQAISPEVGGAQQSNDENLVDSGVAREVSCQARALGESFDPDRIRGTDVTKGANNRVEESRAIAQAAAQAIPSQEESEAGVQDGGECLGQLPFPCSEQLSSPTPSV